jgi:hypothetical protein
MSHTNVLTDYTITTEGVYSPAGGLAHELVSAVVLGDARNVRDVAARIVGALH